MDESVRGFRLPRYTEIPDVGLYLEQTTKYINGYLKPLECLEITSSMISNYVKKGLIPNPVKKQYFAEHIAYLFFVTVAKKLLSMEDIALLLDIQHSSYTAPVAYNYFCDELENMIMYVFGLKESMDKCGETESEEKNILYSLVLSAAQIIYMHARFKSIRKEKTEDNK